MKEMPQNPASDSLTERIRARLPEFIGEKRLNHTFFVEKEAIALAESLDMVYNISDTQKNDLRAAALLHDITKEMPLEKQLELCGKYGIDAGKYPSCAVLHGRTAAFLGRELFGTCINDLIFSAVFNHTTGKEAMSVFDKILFLADYIEPSRTHDSCKKLRAFYYESLQKRGGKAAGEILDEACLACLDDTLSYLLAKGNIIDLETVKARNSFLAKGTPTKNADAHG